MFENGNVNFLISLCFFILGVSVHGDGGANLAVPEIKIKILVAQPNQTV